MLSGQFIRASLLLLGAAYISPAGLANSGDSERVLANLKSSILEYALDNKAYISANSWISSSGAVEEELLVYNRLEFDKLRFQTFDYGKGDRGSRLFGMDAPLKKKRFGRREKSSHKDLACELPVMRKHRVLLSFEGPKSSDAISLNLALHSNKVFLNMMRSAIERGQLGRSLVIYEEDNQKSHYDSYYTSHYQGPSDMRLEVSSNASKQVVKRALKNSLMPWKSSPEVYLVETKVSLLSQSGDNLWSNTLYSRVSAQQSQILLTQLSDSAVSEIKGWAGSLLPIIGRQAQCSGPVALSMANGRAGDGNIIGGKDIGVFKGQRFLLAPRENRLALEGLEKGLKMVSLAEVIDVYENSAVISVYAGISALNYDDMLAIPLSHAGIFEG